MPFAQRALDIRQAPRTPVGRGLARAGEGLDSARRRALLLLGDAEHEASLGLDVQQAQVARRAASQWATRYATHLVVLIVVGTLVAFGGFKVFGVQTSYSRTLTAAGSFTGTDADEDEHGSADGQPAIDALNFELAMPRTQAQQGGSPGAAGSTAASVIGYTVAQGDTVDSVADKFKLMPETVMGSNGIFDEDEALAPGRVLAIPPVDGMFYVVQKNDTLESIAGRFQVEPDAITGYAGNKLAGGLKEGQQLVVPGGMMPARETTLTYTVKKGDTLKGIAGRFGIDVPTLINSNSIPDADNLQPGSQLKVLPVAGLEYKVKKGDTVITVADRYGVTPQMILDYPPNKLTADSTLQIDQVIMVPGGDPNPSTSGQEVVAAARVQPAARSNERPPQSKSTPVPQPKASSQSSAAKSSNNSVKVGTGRMVWPVGGTITQYFSSRHNGLDIAISAGTPIHAADAGRVIWSGWRTDGLGYCVMIDHLNGLTTVYGHMIRQPKVYVGQYVSRGQVIGYIGSTGHSTGPHVHFMVKAGGGTSHAYRNPLAYLGR